MFTSYAQNFEDVMLWRALKHVQNGVYVDVGANHPTIDSVSLAFYERGWRGVHVEPGAHSAQLLRASRPDEIVIQAAVGNGGAFRRFYEIAGTGLSTCDAGIAQRHRASGFAVSETSVPCVSLASVFESCAGREIHWLKIDVEGLEGEVLQGWKPSAARPWIVVLESTYPLTQLESHHEWEARIAALDYQPVFFDGVNRYFLSAAHPELEEAFRAGPNVFDEFALSGTATSPFCALLNQRLAQREQERRAELAASEDRAQRLESEWNAARADVDELNHQVDHWRTMADGLTRELEAVHAGRAWRLSAALRKTDVLMKRSKRALRVGMSAVSGKLRRMARSTLRHAWTHANEHPAIKGPARGLLGHFPVLKARLKAFARANAAMSTPGVATKHPIRAADGDPRLTPHARRMVAGLRAASARKQEDR
jgi:FkbM family methyltransferase